MTSERVLRFEVADAGTLERLAHGPLPAGLEGAAAERNFFRDVFFDTAAGELAERGVVVRLRIREGGTDTLEVEVGEGGAERPVAGTRCRAEVEASTPRELLAGDTEPARLVRAITDPARLGATLELETTRWLRRAHFQASPHTEIHLVGDLVTVRQGKISTDFRELEMRFPEAAAARVAALTPALERELGVRVTSADRLRRARDVLEATEIQLLEHAIRAARAVALLIHDGGRIALLRDGESLRVPTGEGAGEDACRRVLRACFGQAQGQLRLLAHTAAAGTRPAMEVWLAERVFAALGGQDPFLVWIPLPEALEMAGSAIRDARTLTALHTAVRVGLAAARPERGGAEPPPDAGVTPAPPAPEETGSLEPLAAPGDPPSAARVPSLPPEALLNMELSVLAFNERVLALAGQAGVPLLERVRFLAILGSNLDEFFMDRVGGFQRQLASGSTKPTQEGLSSGEQLDVIAIRARRLIDHAYAVLAEALLPALADEGIRILPWDELDEEERRYLRSYYSTQIDAVLTPLAADPSHPFPHIRNLRPALGVLVRAPGSDAAHFAAIELPGDLPRFVPLPGGRRFVPLEEVIRASLPRLYAGMEIVAAYPFRVTRSAALDLDGERISDLLQAVEEQVAKRPFRPTVRLEVDRKMTAQMRDLLLRELQFEARDRISTLNEQDVYDVDGPVDLHALHQIASLPLRELHYPPLERTSPLPPERPIFEVLRERDVLLHFPEDSFEGTVERFLSEAAADRGTLSIKITLYRTSRSSRIVRALRRARARGVQVAAVVELKASFDEQRNIEWARSLEAAGIHVVYGPPHLKVHAKIALVVRREGDKTRRYVYIGTGNLNAATAAAYTDLGLLSSDAELGEEVNDVFNSMTGRATPRPYGRLLVAPVNMRDRFLELIRRETWHAREGREGRIRAKLNGLTDREIIAALSEASGAGVQIDLVVRGICSLRPGLAGFSENIRVVSILGRFLEHSRIYAFGNAGEAEYLIGSADWRPRNLSRRVEVIVPIRDPEHRRELEAILTADLGKADAWELDVDGVYRQRSGSERDEVLAGAHADGSAAPE